jgi:excisionase family DNA binding protein
MMGEDFHKLAFSIDEVAIRSGLGRDAIYDAIRTGRLKAKKMGRRTIIMTDDIRQFLDNLPPLRLPAA